MSLECPYRLLISRQLSELGTVDIPSSGYSMFPAIRPGDICQFAPIHEAHVRPGDILLFVDDDHKLIGHRFIRMINNDAGKHYECKGDTNLLPDKHITKDRLLGKLVTVKRMTRKGKQIFIPADQYVFTMWGAILLHMPFLSVILRRWVFTVVAWHVQREQRQ